jgi:hypothetical protein
MEAEQESESSCIRITEDRTYQRLLEELVESAKDVGKKSSASREVYLLADTEYADALQLFEIFIQDERERSIQQAYVLGKGDCK